MTDAMQEDGAHTEPGTEQSLPGSNVVSMEQLNEQQVSAVRMCTDTAKRIAVVCGPAGTGKTSVIRHVYEQFASQGYRVAVAAPTGKAARRISEATGLQAVTVHKLLEFTSPEELDPETGERFGFTFPRRNKDNPLKQEIVLVDEYSMIPHDLHRQIIDALPPGGLVRAFGDDRQLRPVDDRATHTKRTPLEDLMTRFDSVELTYNYRVQAGNTVAEMAQRIRKGLMPSATQHVSVRYTSNPAQKLEQTVREYQAKGCDFAALDNQIIVPMNKKGLGTLKLNPLIKDIINDVKGSDVGDKQTVLPRKPAAKKEGVQELVVEVGDKVLITSNMYELRPFEERYDSETGHFIDPGDEHMVMNGEVGTITDIDDEDRLYIQFDDRTVCIPPVLEVTMPDGKTVLTDPRLEIDLGYAITVHKAMGSEYNNTIVVLSKSVFYMLSRRLLYTAFTRTREHATLLTDQNALQTAVKNLENKITRDEWSKKGVR